MSSSFGTALRVTIFGQSHAAGIGCVIDGLPAGLTVNRNELAAFMARRAPGSAAWSTARREADEVEIIAGLNERGETCGAPLACLIRNTDVRSGDYAAIARVPRPGHADYTARARWNAHGDVRGGGQFSGRLTAALCAAGGIALQALATRGVHVGAHLLQVGHVHDTALAARNPTDAATLTAQLGALADGRTFPVLDARAGAAMRGEIAEAAEAGDSVGGVIECVACGMPAGVGGPLFDGVESAVARIAFGIPAVKGVEFGAGFGVATMHGSENNDAYTAGADATVAITKNDAGGNLGGITTGAPLVVRMAVKPTPSIARTQRSVNLDTGENAELAVRGRHDPCIAPRAVPVAEASVALALLDCWLAYPPHDTLGVRLT